MTPERALEEFGISEPVERIWRTLVERPTASLTDIGTTSCLPPEELDVALAQLVGTGLLYASDTPSGYAVYEPSMAVQALIGESRREIAERLGRLDKMQTALLPLSDASRADESCRASTEALR